jgi:hypothetical protein
LLTTRPGSPPGSSLTAGPRREAGVAARHAMADRRDYGIVVAAAAAAAFAIGSPKATTPLRTVEAPAAQASSKAGGGGPSAAGDRPLTVRVLTPLRNGREVVRHEDPNPGPIRKMEIKDLDIEFQIATVPDPIESRFGHWFDSTVDAIQLAVETQEYTLDRFYLPWRPGGEEPSRTSALGPTREEDDELAGSVDTVLSAIRDWIANRKSESTWVAKRPSSPKPPYRHRVEPGVLVFRRVSIEKEKKDQYCVILLVGESPVSGIHKDAMALALDIVHDYQAARRRPATIRIIGPWFTSGAASLARVLSDWARSGWQTFVTALGLALAALDVPTAIVLLPTLPPTFSVLSGSSVSTNPYDFEVACRPALASYRATVAPFSVLMSGVLDYLKTLNGGKLKKLAILSESSTTFGATPVKKVQQKAQPQGPRWDVEYTEYANEVVMLHYPFHISQVAVEYSDRGDDARPTLARPSTRLHVPFDGAGTPDDTVPSLALKSTSARDEFGVEHILAGLARGEFTDIGIVATDIRDVIFLVGLIREFCPDVRIFSLESDLTLTHPDFSGKLRGMIYASAYPLYGVTQRWTPYSRPQISRTDQQHQHFLYVSDQGYYNAVLAHFTEASGKKGVDSPMRKAFDYGPIVPGTAGNRPPVWISMVGAHELSPLAYYVPPKPEKDEGSPLFKAYTRYVYDVPEDDEKAKVDHPVAWSWLGAYFGFSALILLLCGASDLGLAGGVGSEAEWRWRVLYRFWPMPGKARTAQDLYITIGLWSLGIISIPLAVVALLRSPGPPEQCEDLWPLLFFLIGLGLTGLSAAAKSWGSRLKRTFALNSVAALLASLCLLHDLEAWLRLLAAQAHGLVIASVFLALLARARAARSLPKFAWIMFIGVALPILAFFAVVGVLRPKTEMNPWHAPKGFSDGIAPLFIDRATTLINGVSPVVPLLVLALGLVLSMLQRLRALYLYSRVLVPGGDATTRPSVNFVIDCVADGLRMCLEHPGRVGRWLKTVGTRLTRIRFVAWLRGLLGTVVARLRKSLGIVDTPAPAPDPWLALPGIDRPADKIDELLIDPSPALRRDPFFLLVLGMLIFGTIRLFSRVLPSPDGWPFTLSCTFIICGTFFVIVTAFARFLMIWSRLRALFRALMQMPMLRAYDRLPAVVGQSYGRYLDRHNPRLSSLRPRVQQLLALLEKDEKLCSIAYPELRPHALPRWLKIRAIEKHFDKEIERGEFGPVCDSWTRKRLRRVASHYLRWLKQNEWPKRTAREAYHTGVTAEGKKEDEDDTKEKAKPEPESVVTMAEDLLAMEFLGIVSQYAAHLRNLATFLALAPLLLVWAVMSYPFIPQQYMLVYLWGAWATIVTGVVYVYIQMDRDAFLSHVSRTRPNHVTFDATFFTSILALVVPILGVILTQFPFISDSLNQWLGPILRVLR